MYISPTKRSFRGPGGVGGLDLRCWAKICARDLASLVSRGLPWPPVVSRGLPLRTGRTHTHTRFGAYLADLILLGRLSSPASG